MDRQSFFLWDRHSLFRIVTLLISLLCTPYVGYCEPESAKPVAPMITEETAHLRSFSQENHTDDVPAIRVPEPVKLRAENIPAPETDILHFSHEENVDIRTILTMFFDDRNNRDVEGIKAQLAEFVPYHEDTFSQKSGSLWLHLDPFRMIDQQTDVVGKSFRELWKSGQLIWLDLGIQSSSDVHVWQSAFDQNWQEITPDARGLYLLRVNSADDHVLIRMDGRSDLWFRPVLRGFSSTAYRWIRSVRLILLSIFGVLALLCLFLSVTERGEGRFWAGGLAIASGLQLFWGIPAISDAVSGRQDPVALAGIFASAISMFMLPHIGRVYMRTRTTSSWTDVLFLIFAFFGACAALIPLLPAMGWTVKFLPFWPLVAIFCFLPSLVLLIRGVQGSGVFSLACLCMGTGGLLSLYGVQRGIDAPVWGIAVYVGSAMGILFLASAAPHRQRESSTSVLDLSAAQPMGSKSNIYRENSLTALRRALKGYVEEFLDEACRLDQSLNKLGESSPEKVEIMTHADGMVALARKLAESVNALPPASVLPSADEQIFELKHIIQTAFSSVFDEAERKGLGLAWYVAPHIGQMFRGDSTRITAMLCLLLRDAVRASSHGAVSLHVQRSGASTHPGHLLFTVSDTGTGRPPRERETMLLSRIWELTSEHDGEFFVEATNQGVEVSFSLECTALEGDGVAEQNASLPQDEEEKLQSPDSDDSHISPNRIIILASDASLDRQLLRYYLEGMGFCLWEARDAEEVVSLYSRTPSAVILLDGSLGEEDLEQCVASIRMIEGELSLPAVPFLLLARSTVQIERMVKAGCEQSLLMPVVRRDLRAMVKWLTSPMGTVPKPVLTTQRITLAAVLAGAHSGTVRMQRKSLRTEAKSDMIVQNTETTETEKYDVTNCISEESSHKPLCLNSEQRAKKGWLSSLFHTAAADSISSEKHPDNESVSKEDVVELLSEQVLDAESGVQVLSEEYRILEELECKGTMSEDIKKGDAQDFPEVQSVADPAVVITDGLDQLSSALLVGDIQGIRHYSRKLSLIADTYGMHTLADMARCFRVAWEDGDMEAAAQIVEEMRAESARAI